MQNINFRDDVASKFFDTIKHCTCSCEKVDLVEKHNNIGQVVE